MDAIKFLSTARLCITHSRRGRTYGMVMRDGHRVGDIVIDEAICIRIRVPEGEIDINIGDVFAISSDRMSLENVDQLQDMPEFIRLIRAFVAHKK